MANEFIAVLAFDVYGTLIDPLRMEEHLRPAFGEKAREAAELWRSKQLEYSFRRALMKKYSNFDECTAQAFRFVCAQMGVDLEEKARSTLLSQYLHLPAYPDVSDALEALRARGFMIVACTNGVEKSVRTLLDHAGVLPFFSKILSVDTLRTFKPDPAVYEHLLSETRTRRVKVWLISSNAFDVIGAKACWLRTAWVRRDPKRVFDPWEFEPDVIVSSLTELSKKISI